MSTGPETLVALKIPMHLYPKHPKDHLGALLDSS